MDERAHTMWGVERGERQVTFEDLSARIHPADLDRVRSAFEATREVLGAYELDFRILHGNDTRWVSARGQGDDMGIVGRVMFGVFLDVTERKEAEETRELLAGEMSHRVKNLFAVTAALTSIAARSASSTDEMAADLRQRLSALGRAHDLVRPVQDSQSQGAVLLCDLLAVLLGPYDSTGAVGDRIRIRGPKILVGESSTTTVALVVHELATNSLKYGSLSAARGTVDLSCSDHHGEANITWTERGGPPTYAPEQPPGFGTKLVSRSVAGQLGGSVEPQWHVEGLVVTIRMETARLAA
jgi:two-component sensor histidine kinase